MEWNWRCPLTRCSDKFKSEYLYNIRHSYGDVGGDANRRGRGYTPYSCQKLLTEALPGSGQTHGCPYRTYSPENLIPLLQSVGVSDRDLHKRVRELVAKQRYHIACNEVFESAHKTELKKVSAKRADAGVLKLICYPRLRMRTSGLRVSSTPSFIPTPTSNAASSSRTSGRFRLATLASTDLRRLMMKRKSGVWCQVSGVHHGKVFGGTGTAGTLWLVLRLTSFVLTATTCSHECNFG